jgi:hypothetical protein
LSIVGVSIREVWPIGSGYFRAKPSPVWIPQQFSNSVILHLPAYEDRTVCSETSAYKIQRPGNYPEEKIQHTKHGKKFEINNTKIFTFPELEPQFGGHPTHTKSL